MMLPPPAGPKQTLTYGSMACDATPLVNGMVHLFVYNANDIAHGKEVVLAADALRDLADQATVHQTNEVPVPPSVPDTLR